MNLSPSRDHIKIAVKNIQDTAYPLKLVINPSWGGSLGLRHQAEIFYLNFPTIITINPENNIDHEEEVCVENFHLIRTDFESLLKQIKIERKRALKHYMSVVLKFFFKEQK